MALIKCPECGRDISDRAVACIHCGFPLNEGQQPQPLQQTTVDTQAIAQEADRLRLEKKYLEAIELYKKAATLGHAHSQLWLSNIYDRGLGVDNDYSKALYWFEMAARQSNAPAISNLGFMYENGRGVPKDEKRHLSII